MNEKHNIRLKRHTIMVVRGLLILVLLSLVWSPSLSYLVDLGSRAARNFWMWAGEKEEYPEELIRTQLRTGKIYDLPVVSKLRARCVEVVPDKSKLNSDERNCENDLSPKLE